MYEGQFFLDKRHGFGRLFWNDGTYYIGKWSHDLRHGYGKLIQADGKILQGTWMNDMLEEEHSEREDEQPQAANFIKLMKK